MTGRMTTYQPTGRGLCAQCGRDVGAHVDPAHQYRDWLVRDPLTRQYEVRRCCEVRRTDPIHDVGRALRCPEVRDA